MEYRWQGEQLGFEVFQVGDEDCRDYYLVPETNIKALNAVAYGCY